MLKILCMIILTFSFKISEAKTIVISKNTQLKNISKYELVNIFTGKKQKWDNGDKIIVFVKSQKTLEHRDFTYSILGISPTRYNDLINNEVKNKKYIFEVSSDEEMIMKVLQVPGSIGYVNYYEDFDKDLNFLN